MMRPLLALAVLLCAGCVEPFSGPSPQALPVLEAVASARAGGCGHERADVACHAVNVTIRNPVDGVEVSTNPYAWRAVTASGGSYPIYEAVGPDAVRPGGTVTVSFQVQVEPVDVLLARLETDQAGVPLGVDIPAYTVEVVPVPGKPLPLELEVTGAVTGTPCSYERVCEDIRLHVRNPDGNPTIHLSSGYLWRALDARGGMYDPVHLDAPDAVAAGGEADVRLLFDIDDPAVRVATVQHGDDHAATRAAVTVPAYG